MPNETLLDVGCGDAAYLDLFECDATGIDPSEELLNKYKGNHQVLELLGGQIPQIYFSFSPHISRMMGVRLRQSATCCVTGCA